jgi:hypothetical protein
MAMVSMARRVLARLAEAWQVVARQGFSGGIAQMELQECVYRIVGLSPLLQHAPNGMNARSERLGRKDIPSPEQEAAAGAYRLPDGQMGHPACAFRSAMLEACKGRRIGKWSAKTIMQGAVFNVPDQVLLPLEHPDTGKPLTEYEVDVRRVVVQGNGIMRARPRLDKWAGFVTLEIDPNFITPDRMEMLTELLNIGGRTVGVGELRPKPPKGIGGPYGRFEAELVTS